MSGSTIRIRSTSGASVRSPTIALAVYGFFGTEPLANYLYGLAGLAVPGLTGGTDPSIGR